MKITGTIGSVVRTAIVTAVIGGAALVGYTALTDGSVSPTPSFAPIPDGSRAVYHGPVLSNRGASNNGISVPSAPRTSFRSTSASSFSSGHYNSAFNASNSGSSQNIGRIGSTYHQALNSAGGGGGGAADASSGSSVPVLAMAPAMSGSGNSAMAPRRAQSLRGSLAGRTPFEELEVYTGDKPGIITYQENNSVENPVVTCYDLPIGDGAGPLLLIAIVFFLYKKRKRIMGMFSAQSGAE